MVPRREVETAPKCPQVELCGSVAHTGWNCSTAKKRKTGVGGREGEREGEREKGRKEGKEGGRKGKKRKMTVGIINFILNCNDFQMDFMGSRC